MSYNLLEFSRGGGCGCKIDPIKLHAILSDHKAKDSNALLVDFLDKDDASVIEINEQTCLIQTVDFFLPLVNNAFDFGRIAAANAISDVYAMGGNPIFALAVLGWPLASLPASVAAEVMNGARKTCAEAGIVIAGGHSIDSQDPIFGLVVNGLVPIENLKRNDTAQEGDVLILTKPLGVGIMATSQKRGLLSDADLTLLVKQLTTINKAGAALGKIKGVHAMTDVTGFGLLGHLTEMMQGSNLTATIRYNQIPIIKEVRTYIAQKAIPGATARNWASCKEGVYFGEGVDEVEAVQLLPDPQTNGGLLIAVAPSALSEVQNILTAMGIAYQQPIGECSAASEKRIIVNKD